MIEIAFINRDGFVGRFGAAGDAKEAGKTMLAPLRSGCDGD